MAPITHVVIFQYKSDTTREQKEDIARAFLALRQNCLSPANANFDYPGSPYIQSIIAGSNNSREGAAEGYEHGYIVTFASPEHRDYYVGQDPLNADPAHNAFKEKVGPALEKVVVIDFADGVWENK